MCVSFVQKQFSNLCGAVYRQGNVLFTNDGDSVFSPVGNRVSQFDLKRYLYINTHHVCELSRGSSAGIRAGRIPSRTVKIFHVLRSVQMAF